MADLISPTLDAELRLHENAQEIIRAKKRAPFPELSNFSNYFLFYFLSGIKSAHKSGVVLNALVTLFLLVLGSAGVFRAAGLSCESYGS
jgi:hypothetical protein